MWVVVTCGDEQKLKLRESFQGEGERRRRRRKRVMLLLPSCAVVGCEHLQTHRYMLRSHTHDIGHTYIRTYVCACVRTHIHVRTPSQKTGMDIIKVKAWSGNPYGCYWIFPTTYMTGNELFSFPPISYSIQLESVTTFANCVLESSIRSRVNNDVQCVLDAGRCVTDRSAQHYTARMNLGNSFKMAILN